MPAQVSTTKPAEGGRRERKKSATAQRILEAAMRTFTAKGFTDATVEEITEAADVGKGTFFNYFPSKEHVLLAIMHLMSKRFDSLGHAPEGVSTRDHLRAFAHKFMLKPVPLPLLFRNVFGIVTANHALREPMVQLIQHARGELAKLLQQGQERGEVRSDIPATDLAMTFQQFIIGTQLVWSIDEQGDLKKRVDLMFEIFWMGACSQRGGKR